MTQNLINYEKNERVLTTQLLNRIPTVKDYSFTSGHICYDCLINLKDGRTIIGEVKVRNFELGKYPDYILQVDKVVNLNKQAVTNHYDLIYYINFFKSSEPNRVDFIIFNLTERIKEWRSIRPEVKKMWMNSETHLSTTNKTEKEVILLRYNEKIDMTGYLK